MLVDIFMVHTIRCLCFVCAVMCHVACCCCSITHLNRQQPLMVLFVSVLYVCNVFMCFVCINMYGYYVTFRIIIINSV